MPGDEPTYREDSGFQVSTVKNKTGNPTNGEKRKEVTWSKRDERNLDIEFVSMFSSSAVPCIPADS